jgi:AbiTii
MKLVDDIVELAVDSQQPVAVLLRKCLVLAHQLRNTRLKTWAESELNGYKSGDVLPPYRQPVIVAKGTFLGPFGAAIYDQPIPAALLQEQHRHFAERASLTQPIAAYDKPPMGKDGKLANAMIPWPANLTVLYQNKVIDGYALNRAWQEIPASVFLSLTDTVRNRILQLALELKDELGLVCDNPDKLPKGKIDQHVTYYIFGGNNVIAETVFDFAQSTNITVALGDLKSLALALKSIGLDDSAIGGLKTALARDVTDPASPSPAIGKRAHRWLNALGTKVGKESLKVGADVAKAVATKWIMQYLGME